MILVHVHTLELDRHAVQEESLVLVEINMSDACDGRVFIGKSSIHEDLGHNCI